MQPVAIGKPIQPVDVGKPIQPVDVGKPVQPVGGCRQVVKVDVHLQPEELDDINDGMCCPIGTDIVSFCVPVA